MKVEIYIRRLMHARKTGRALNGMSVGNEAEIINVWRKAAKVKNTEGRKEIFVRLNNGRKRGRVG